MDKIRWGIIGTGGIARAVAGDLAQVPGAELYAVGSRAAETARSYAAAHDVPRAYGSYRELLDDDLVDVVYVATPHPQHRDVALAAIERGKAVLVEKAFAATYAGAQQVVAAARERGTFLMEGMWTRFLPAIRAAKEVAAWGRVGDLVGVQGDLIANRAFDPVNRLFNPELGGGSLLDLGVYPVSLAQHFLGEVKEISCFARLYPNGVDASAAVNLRHVGDALSSLTVAFDGHGPGRFIVSGTRGWIEVEPRFHHPTTITINRSGQLPRIIETRLTGKGYAHEFAEVTELVRQGATESETMPLADTLEVMRVLDECVRQAGITYRDAELAL
ncbi:Gfo/Idh/MocA family protein [Tessaracoccus sp. OH4464_COT-324]|uniref:Gfo/Idh/MocA family protein n=1 Tax=Tessaracoccus sp. OH4464_COT-324 TaxID=2491059 RepID=UPI000F642B90|nr:Gfo/Idh/MocA family oxidoreductase [Tessaracoccus sp. OH4464_COT-324]RRD46048.1 gfo/Idh/MocA family oxidoreductase [Tessaracoccus sp. OH4464_COT-324]